MTGGFCEGDAGSGQRMSRVLGRGRIAPCVSVLAVEITKS